MKKFIAVILEDVLTLHYKIKMIIQYIFISSKYPKLNEDIKIVCNSNKQLYVL
jgi:hypothetical protein